MHRSKGPSLATCCCCLPGQILFTDDISTDIKLYTPTITDKDRHFQRKIAPEIVFAPPVVTPGGSYQIEGFRFNGVTLGAATVMTYRLRPTTHSYELPTCRRSMSFTAARMITAAWLWHRVTSCRRISTYPQARKGASASCRWLRTGLHPNRCSYSFASRHRVGQRGGALRLPRLAPRTRLVGGTDLLKRIEQFDPGAAKILLNSGHYSQLVPKRNGDDVAVFDGHRLTDFFQFVLLFGPDVRHGDVKTKNAPVQRID